MNGELVFNGSEFHLGKTEKFWRRLVLMVAQQRECTYCHRTVCFKMVKVVKFYAFFTTIKKRNQSFFVLQADFIYHLMDGKTHLQISWFLDVGSGPYVGTAGLIVCLQPPSEWFCLAVTSMMSPFDATVKFCVSTCSYLGLPPAQGATEANVLLCQSWSLTPEGKKSKGNEGRKSGGWKETGNSESGSEPTRSESQ